MPAQVITPKHDWMVFHLAGIACALDVREILEVILCPALVQSPAQPVFLDGFLNLRGAAVPVAPLHSLFGLPAPAPEIYAPILVIAEAGGRLGLRVDGVDEIAAVDPAAVQPHTANDAFNACAVGQVRLEGADVVLLSGPRLLLAREQQVLAEFQAQAQRRLDRLREDPPQ